MSNQEEPEENEEQKHGKDDPEDLSPSQDENRPEERIPSQVSSNQQVTSSSRVLRKYFETRAVTIASGETSNASMMNENFQRSSRDASTNTAPPMERADGSFTERNINMKGWKCPNCIKGVIWFHVWCLSTFPRLEKFLFFIPIRYGVYTIIASEEIYFFLRSYSRVLHLAMPSFFPDLYTWLATTELLLSLAIMFSDLLLLFGVFINPNYILCWIDIHLVQIFIYLYLSIWLSMYGAVTLFHFPLVFSAYILAFLYSIVIVNSFRRMLGREIACPSDLGPPPQELV